MTNATPSPSGKSPKRIPGYLHHNATGQARVRIDGHDYYLGPYGSVESRVEYGKLIANHAAGLPIAPVALVGLDDVGLTINELVLAFMVHAKKHYIKNDKPTSEIHCLQAATRPLVELYGFTPANKFGPLALKAVRSKMIELKWVRKSINKSIGRLRSIFRWGVENEIIDDKVLSKLVAVAPLLAGRTDAKDNPKRTGVSDEDINAVRADVGELIRDLIDLQRFMGARSGEILGLTADVIDRTGDVWSANLGDHKTVHHGHTRVLAIGPKAQAVLMKYLGGKPAETMFQITTAAYRRAVTRSCARLNIPKWVPHQLRHTTAGKIRSEFGLEHTQAVLGHATADMSEHYAKVSQAKANEVARRIG